MRAWRQMSMNGRTDSRQWHWRGHWVPTLLTAMILPCLLWLGQWQLGRAEEKRVLLDALAEQSALPPLKQLPDEKFAAAGRELRLQGTFDPQRRFYLDNRIIEGRVGYEIVELFRTDSGQWLMLNRGWVAATTDRRILPAVSVPEGPQTIIASLYRPLGEAIVLRDEQWPDPNAPETWPLRVQAIDIQSMSEYLSEPLYPYELRINPRDPVALTARWTGVNMTPSRHQGYAVTWFALAISLLIAWTVASFGRDRK